jgi:hypothetical protein
VGSEGHRGERCPWAPRRLATLVASAALAGCQTPEPLAEKLTRACEAQRHCTGHTGVCPSAEETQRQLVDEALARGCAEALEAHAACVLRFPCASYARLECRDEQGELDTCLEP